MNPTPSVILAFLATPFLAFAGPDGKSNTDSKLTKTLEEKPWCESLWEIPTIYKNSDNPFIEEIRIVGRFHGDVYHLDSDSGYDQDWTVRRLRIGGRIQFLKDFTLHVEVDLNPQNPRPLYNRLTDAYLAWKPSEAFKLTLGKHSVKFTLDGATSSNELLTIDRSNIANNLWFPNEYISGVSISGKIGNWQYNTGFYSGGTDSPEFGNFDAGNFWLGSVGYDFGKTLGVKKALLRLDYVYNDPNLESTSVRPFENIGALVFQLENGRWGFSAEGEVATGFGTQSNVRAFGVMPWFNITDKLQAVTRYTYLTSDEPNGIRLARYDSFVTAKKGSEYHEIYGGLNYYICGHRLKLQTGVSYVVLNEPSIERGEYHSWQWTSGLRVSW
jgi:phosphate-selective porin OprO/OprP